jgi:hypothetical protein
VHSVGIHNTTIGNLAPCAQALQDVHADLIAQRCGPSCDECKKRTNHTKQNTITKSSAAMCLFRAHLAASEPPQRPVPSCTQAHIRAQPTCARQNALSAGYCHHVDATLDRHAASQAEHVCLPVLPATLPHHSIATAQHWRRALHDLLLEPGASAVRSSLVRKRSRSGAQRALSAVLPPDDAVERAAAQTPAGQSHFGTTLVVAGSTAAPSVERLRKTSQQHNRDHTSEAGCTRAERAVAVQQDRNSEHRLACQPGSGSAGSTARQNHVTKRSRNAHP